MSSQEEGNNVQGSNIDAVAYSTNFSNAFSKQILSQSTNQALFETSISPPPSPKPTSSQVTNFKNGEIFVGLANIKDLDFAKNIRSSRGTQASVFDPAMICLLAKNYTMGKDFCSIPTNQFDSNSLNSPLSPTSSNQPIEFSNYESDSTFERETDTFAKCQSDYESAIRACRINQNVAESAGLRCRASVWLSLEALIPKPSEHDLFSSVSANGIKSPIKDDFLAKEETSLGDKVNIIDDLILSPAKLPAGKNPSKSNSLTESLKNYSGLPFSFGVISMMLKELLEDGDSQHFVIVCEILRTANLFNQVFKKSTISGMQLRRVYLSYIDLLKKLELFCEANEIIKSSDDSFFSDLSKASVEISIKCSKCEKKIEENSSQPYFCNNCSLCITKCSLCHKPIKGLYHWCPICSHGGHFECMKSWFSRFNSCPSGCGHDCCVSLSSLPLEMKKINKYKPMYIDNLIGIDNLDSLELINYPPIYYLSD